MTLEDFIHAFSAVDDAAEAPLAQRRLVYERLHADRRTADPADLRITDDAVAGVKVRRFSHLQGLPGQLVYLHGGGWNLGSVASHHAITANLATRLQRDVISVDYRLLPEASYAEALNDCRRVVQALDPAAVIGDSAGGRLAIDVAHTSEWKGLLGLIYPVVGTPKADTLGEDAPLLSRADILSLWQMAAAHVPDIAIEHPPSMIIEALAVERDPLTRPLEQAVEQWREAGASVGYRCAPGMVHSALHGHAELPAMQSAWQDFCQALAKRLADGV